MKCGFQIAMSYSIENDNHMIQKWCLLFLAVPLIKLESVVCCFGVVTFLRFSFF